MGELLLTQEVGSLAKPSWRVQPVDGLPVTKQHIADAADWAERLGLDPDESTELLLKAQQEDGPLDPETETAIKLLAARYAIRLQERAGLDILYDGEQDRPEMYQSLVENATGFEPRGRRRVFDNKSYLASAVVDLPGIEEPAYKTEFARIQAETDRVIKVPITGAYTVADWSFDEYYVQRLERGGRGLSEEEAKRSFVLDVATHVVRPNIAALAEAGAEWIQIDEPAATTKPHEVPLFVEAFNRSVAGLAGKFSVHICFPEDYGLLFPHVQELEGCSQFSLEFANRDGRELGTDAASRPAYEILHEFKKRTPDIAIGLGVSSVHDNDVEAAELVRDRVLRALEIIGDPTKINPSPDCGLRTRGQSVAFDKLKAVVEGTRLAREQLE
jgi:5-methyltetrahydropteroyltriglutamate--homocysteine methyltransferase